jgi:pilus assembly protein FimV
MANEPSPTATQDITADSAAARARADASAPDFMLDATAQNIEPDITVDAPDEDPTKSRVEDVTGDTGRGMATAIDFNFDATATVPAAAPDAVIDFPKNDTGIPSAEPDRDKAAGLNLDFEMDSTANVPAASDIETTTQVEPDLKFDLGRAPPLVPDFKLDDINLELDEAAKPAPVKTESGAAKDDHWYDVQTKFDLAKAYQEMGDKDGAREILQEVIKEGDAPQQAEAKQLLDTLG